jgi:hypothetical protein
MTPLVTGACVRRLLAARLTTMALAPIEIADLPQALLPVDSK